MTEAYRGAGRGTLFFNEKGRRLDGYGTGGNGRYGFDYRGFVGAPNDYSGSSSGRYSDDYRLPNGGGGSLNSAPSGPTAPAPSDPVPQAPSVENMVPAPFDGPNGGRPAPTAARLIPIPN